MSEALPQVFAFFLAAYDPRFRGAMIARLDDRNSFHWMGEKIARSALPQEAIEAIASYFPETEVVIVWVEGDRLTPEIVNYQ